MIKKDNIKEIANLIKEQNIFYLQNGMYYILPEEGKINANPSHINNGFCYQYAYDLQQKLLSLNINSDIVEIEYLEIPHAFLKINNFFYDSETAFGVDNYEHLPVFNNIKKKDSNFFQKILKKIKI